MFQENAPEQFARKMQEIEQHVKEYLRDLKIEYDKLVGHERDIVDNYRLRAEAAEQKLVSVQIRVKKELSAKM